MKKLLAGLVGIIAGVGFMTVGPAHANPDPDQGNYDVCDYTGTVADGPDIGAPLFTVYANRSWNFAKTFNGPNDIIFVKNIDTDGSGDRDGFRCFLLVGTPGPAGPPGLSVEGAKGDPGADGAAGTNGKNGENGADGAPGRNGDAGATGPSGAIGPSGAAGLAGAAGSAGPMGIAGADGSAGPMGATGSVGAAGLASAAPQDATVMGTTLTRPDELPRTGFPTWLLGLGLVVFIIGGVTLTASKLQRHSNV